MEQKQKKTVFTYFSSADISLFSLFVLSAILLPTIICKVLFGICVFLYWLCMLG